MRGNGCTHLLRTDVTGENHEYPQAVSQSSFEPATFGVQVSHYCMEQSGGLFVVNNNKNWLIVFKTNVEVFLQLYLYNSTRPALVAFSLQYKVNHTSFTAWGTSDRVQNGGTETERDEAFIIQHTKLQLN